MAQRQCVVLKLEDMAKRHRQRQRQLKLQKEMAQRERERQRERQPRPCKPTNKIVECPFDKSHFLKLRTSGGQSHLYQCRKKFVEASGLPIEKLKLEQCKYNANHIILSIELDFHETHHCADRPRPLRPPSAPRHPKPATSVTSSDVHKSSIFRVQIVRPSEQTQAGTAKKEEKDVANVQKGLQDLSLAKKKKKRPVSGKKTVGFAQCTGTLVGGKVDPPQQSSTSAMGKEGNNNTTTGKDEQQKEGDDNTIGKDDQQKERNDNTTGKDDQQKEGNDNTTTGKDDQQKQKEGVEFEEEDWDAEIAAAEPRRVYTPWTQNVTRYQCLFHDEVLALRRIRRAISFPERNYPLPDFSVFDRRPKPEEDSDPEGFYLDHDGVVGKKVRRRRRRH